MPDVVLVTGRRMPGPETETPLLAAALHEQGVDATIEPWGSTNQAVSRLVVIRTPWDYSAHREEFLGWVRTVAAATRVVNPVEVLEWNSHKSYLLDLAYAGVPVIPTALVPKGASGADQHSALEEYEGEVVIKPAVSAGAVGVLLAGALSPEAAAHLRLLTESGDVLVQPFEPTVADGEISLVYLGGEFSHAVRKVPADGDFRAQAHLGGSVVAHDATSDEREVAAAALATVAADLSYGRVDMVATARGPAVMELELIEPQLFLEVGVSAARFAAHLVGLLAGS
jgi:glutathione synthase/RimK-type ligase-like ATP-grasp enzyme